jgi:hypothetical protein
VKRRKRKRGVCDRGWTEEGIRNKKVNWKGKRGKVNGKGDGKGKEKRKG